MPFPAIGILALSGLYYAKKNYQKHRNKKGNKQSLTHKSSTALAESKAIKSAYEKEIDQKIILSVVLMVLTIAGSLGYPLLTLIGIPGFIYLSLPIIRLGYRELFKQGKIGAAVLDGTIAVAMLVLQYFFASSLYFTLYYISRKILLKTEDASRESLMNIWGDTPQSIWVEQAGVEVEIAFEALQQGDIVVVNAGETIPIDGVITKGVGNVDQHILTGEAQPLEKAVGDGVFASTVLLAGKLYIKVDKAGTETVAAKIKDTLDKTADYKSSVQARGERLAEQSALPTLMLGGVTLPILGVGSAVTVLLSSFGAQMRVVAPISVLNFLKIAAEQGVLVKDGRALELLHQVDTVVFDKTGTLTQEQPYVSAVHTCEGYHRDDVLSYAATAEYKQKHPIALAILHAAHAQQLALPDIDDSSYEVGYGLKVRVGDKCIRVGSMRFMQLESIAIPTEIQALQAQAYDQGASFVYVAVNAELSGAIELHATIRPEAKPVIEQLHQRGMRVAIISGDHEKPTQQLAQTLGIDQYFAETLPENKAELIAALQQQGRTVCFVGDGINDSIALKKANVSISLRGAATIATDTAQMILMDESLKNLPYLFELGNNLDNNLQTGYAIALTPGILCVGGVYLLHIGVVTAGVLYNLSLSAGVVNAMLPKFDQHLLSRDSQEDETPAVPNLTPHRQGSRTLIPATLS